MTAEAWDYLQGGAEDEITLAESVAAFRRRRFVPRVLVERLGPRRVWCRERVMYRRPPGAAIGALRALEHRRVDHPDKLPAFRVDEVTPASDLEAGRTE